MADTCWKDCKCVFIITNNKQIFENVTVLKNFTICSHHTMVRALVEIDLGPKEIETYKGIFPRV